MMSKEEVIPEILIEHMVSEKNIPVPKFEELKLPFVPSYIPERFRKTIQDHVDHYILQALLYAYRESKQSELLDQYLYAEVLDFYNYRVAFYKEHGFLMPEDFSPASIKENHFAVSGELPIGNTDIAECFAGVMVNEETREAVGFHCWPLSKWPEDVALCYAIGYWKTLQVLAPIEPTRFDFASSRGGWKWSSSKDNHREKRQTKSHEIMLKAFKYVFGAESIFSLWTTAQILYEPNENRVTDPVRGLELPKQGSTEYWSDLEFEETRLRESNVVFTHD